MAPVLPRQRRPALEEAYRKANRELESAIDQVERTRSILSKASRDLTHSSNWLAQHEREIGRQPQVEAQLAADRIARVEQVRTDAPAWVAHHFGQRPEQPDLSAAWENAVGIVEQYRQVWNVAEVDPPMGHEPHWQDPAHDDWCAASAAVHDLSQQLVTANWPHLENLSPLSQHRRLDHDHGLSIDL